MGVVHFQSYLKSPRLLLRVRVVLWYDEVSWVGDFPSSEQRNINGACVRRQIRSSTYCTSTNKMLSCLLFLSEANILALPSVNTGCVRALQSSHSHMAAVTDKEIQVSILKALFHFLATCSVCYPLCSGMALDSTEQRLWKLTETGWKGAVETCFQAIISGFAVVPLI